MEYRTFHVSVKEDGNLEFFDAVEEYAEGVDPVAKLVTEQTDWDDGPILAVGIELHPGLEYGWAIYSRQSRDELAQNIRDEQLGELTGNKLSPDAVVRERSLGHPDVQS